MARQRERVFRTNLSIEECRERLRREARGSFFFPDLRGKEFAWGFKRDKFWLRIAEYDKQAAMLLPMLYGSLSRDDYSHGTIVKVHFGRSDIQRAGIMVAPFLGIGFLAAIYSSLKSMDWWFVAILIFVVVANAKFVYKSKPIVRRQQAAMIRCFERLLEAEPVRK